MKQVTEIKTKTKDQNFFLSGLYFLEAMKEEQEETKQYVQRNYKEEKKWD